VDWAEAEVWGSGLESDLDLDWDLGWGPVAAEAKAVHRVLPRRARGTARLVLECERPTEPTTELFQRLAHHKRQVSSTRELETKDSNARSTACWFTAPGDSPLSNECFYRRPTC